MCAERQAYCHAGFGGLIGVARGDITPPAGVYSRNWGAAKHDVARGAHCPLTVTVIILQEGVDDEPLVLISIDLIGLGGLDNELVGGVCDEFGIDEARLMFHTVHTHAGPSLRGLGSGIPAEKKTRAYNDKMAATVMATVRAAMDDRREGELTWSYGRCGLAVNRDLRDPNSDRFICGYNPDKEADDTLLVGRVTGGNGEVRATLVNYACHPTTLAWANELLSPDWIGAMRSVVEGASGGGICLFMQGASGELSPRRQYTGDVDVADQNGRQVGYAVLSVLEGMLPAGQKLSYKGVVESGAPLAVWECEEWKASRELKALCENVELEIKVDLPTSDELEEQLAATDDRVYSERIRRKLAIRRDIGEGRRVGVPIWVWRVGDMFIVGQPNEAYSALQMGLREAFCDTAVVVMNCVNGSMGYLPPRDLYNDDIYQVWQTPFARGGHEKNLEACIKGVRRLSDSV